MSLPAAQIPLLVLSVVILSVGLVALLDAALYREQKPGLAYFGFLALGIAWEAAVPLWSALPPPVPPGVLVRAGAAQAFLLPLFAFLFLTRFLGVPWTPVRRVLAALPAALGALAFLRPDLGVLAAVAPVSFLALVAGFLRVLLGKERRSRRHMAVLFVATAVLVLGALADLASRRHVLLAGSTSVPALAPAFLFFSLLVLYAMADEERRLVARATTDPLTTLPNRAAFLDRARSEVQRADRTGRSLALVMLDIDHFKSFNDRFGHQTGDRVLAAVAQAIARTIRGIDVAGRYGGEEFVVLLVEADQTSAPQAVERIREAVSSLAPPRVPARLTLSAGVAVHHGLFERAKVESLIRRADAALYEAKRAGRDRVQLEHAVSAAPSTPSQVVYRR